jgi:hypothetical protein
MQGVPEMLPHPLILFRNVNRCFQIDNLPLVVEVATSGVLAALLHRYFPALQDLYLDATTGAELECWSVGHFCLWRSVILCQEYESWWVSTDGQAFQAARATNDLSAVEKFNIPWYQTELDFDPYPNQNRFANTQHSGYQFI